MKLIEMISNREEAFKWLKTKRPIALFNYEFNNGVIDCAGGVLFNDRVDKLEVKFGKVAGTFDMTNQGIKNLDGFPNEVGGDVYIRYCKNLTSLAGIHKNIKKIHGDIIFTDVPIKSHILGLIMINIGGGLNFRTSDNKLQLAFEIVEKHIGRGKAGVIAAQQELIDADLDDFAEL